MRMLSFAPGLIGICVVFGGCTYSPGPWIGLNERIHEYQPAMEEVKPAVAEPAKEPILVKNVVGPESIAETDVFVGLETEPFQANGTDDETTVKEVKEPGVAEAPAEVVTITESVVETIDKIGNIDSNSTKRRLYLAIAKRDDIDEAAQVSLVNAVFDNLFSETAMEDVLITLIQNPKFTGDCKEAILGRVGDFFSESSKRRILGALPEE